MFFNVNLRFTHVYTPPPQFFLSIPPPQFQTPGNNPGHEGGEGRGWTRDHWYTGSKHITKRIGGEGERRQAF